MRDEGTSKTSLGHRGTPIGLSFSWLTVDLPNWLRRHPERQNVNEEVLLHCHRKDQRLASANESCVRDGDASPDAWALSREGPVTRRRVECGSASHSKPD
jgi:hypothetical protein